MAEFKKPVFLQDEAQTTQGHDIGVVDTDIIDARYIAVKNDPNNKLIRQDDGSGNFELVVNSLATGNIELDIVPKIPDTVDTVPAVGVPMMRTGNNIPLPTPVEWGRTTVNSESRFVPLYRSSPDGSGGSIKEFSELVAGAKTPKFVEKEKVYPTIKVNGSDWFSLHMYKQHWGGYFPRDTGNDMEGDVLNGSTIPERDVSTRLTGKMTVTGKELLRIAQTSFGAHQAVYFANSKTDEVYMVLPSIFNLRNINRRTNGWAKEGHNGLPETPTGQWFCLVSVSHFGPSDLSLIDSKLDTVLGTGKGIIVEVDTNA